MSEVHNKMQEANRATVENSTQVNKITLPDINVTVNIKVTFDQSTLTSFFNLFKPTTPPCVIPVIEPEEDEPAELTPNIPETLQAPIKRVPIKRKWIKIKNHPHLTYTEENGKLLLNYAGSVAETTWDVVEKVAKIEPQLWKHEIEKMLGGGAPTSNRKAAVSLFLKLVASGEIKRPDDPDAAFRPMLREYYPTKPDENCGNIESTQGAY